MTPIATWLRATRERHGLSQESLVAEINAWAEATDQRNDRGERWTLYRPNYVGWEGGKKAKPETVERLIAFWQSKDEPAPDLTPKPAPLSLEERAVLAAERQADAMERQANSTSLLVTILSAWLPADARRALPEGVQSELARAMADMAHQFAAREETQSRPRVPAAR
jgi:hypothetical protein